MFVNFYGLQEVPFGVTPDPRFYYPSRSHREALASLTYAIQCRTGFAALVAEPGMGKTMLLRRLLQDFERCARAAFLLDTDACVDPLSAILAEFGIAIHAADRVTACAKLKEIIIQENRAGRFVLLIIDEAQNLELGALESIRLLSNFETDKAKLLQIVLGGQPRLAEKLCAANLRQLYQRIPIGGSLERFDRKETESYVAHRLSVAGYGGPPLFSAEAMDTVACESGGIPRQINSLCFSALSLACALQKREIDVEVMREVVHDARWAQRIAAQHKADAQGEAPAAEPARSCQAAPLQFHPGDGSQSATGKQVQSFVSDAGRWAHEDLGQPAKQLSGVAAPAAVRRPDSALRQPARVAPQLPRPPNAVIGRSAAATRRRRHSGVVMLAAATAVLIIGLLGKQTDSGRAFGKWTTAQMRAVINAEQPRVPERARDADAQPRLAMAPGPARRERREAGWPSPKANAPAKTAADVNPGSVAAPQHEQPAADDGSWHDSTEVVVRHSAKLAGPRQFGATRVIIEPEAALTTPARPTLESGETQSGAVWAETQNQTPAIAMARSPASPPVFGRRMPAVAMNRIAPAYPEVAQRWGMQGMVSLEAEVDKQGRVTQVRRIGGPLLFADAAAKAVKHWKYQPATVNGEPVESTVQVSIRFELGRSMTPGTR